MDNNHVSENVLEKIKREHINPAPPAVFWLKRLFFWLAALVFLFFGSIASATLFFVLFNNDWDLYGRFANNTFGFTIKVFPYFWLLFCILFVALAWYNYRHTKFGYRARIVYVIIFYIVFTGLSGVWLYKQGIGHKADMWFAKNFSIYNQLNYSRGMWLKPQAGFLSGTITAATDNILSVRDSQGKDWSVIISSSTTKGLLLLESGSQIKILGFLDNDNKFVAQELRPWCGCGGCAAGENSCGLGGCEANSKKMKENCCNGRISK